jgi:hypothetical protein
MHILLSDVCQIDLHISDAVSLTFTWIDTSVGTRATVSGESGKISLQIYYRFHQSTGYDDINS